MQPTVKLGQKEFNGGIDDVRKAMAQLSKARVLVGIPEAETSRPGETVTNAGLMYIHTHGSEARHIPARPVIEPAIEAPDNQKRITDALGTVASAALDGDDTLTLQNLRKAGQIGSNAAKRWFRDPRNNWPPNSEKTIAAKGSDRPLIDTGELRRAITYVAELD